jgi:probable lipoprotein NlpC
LLNIEKYVGVPYKMNGRSPEEGLDCWGLVKCVYKDLGIWLPSWDARHEPDEDWYKHDPERYYRFLLKIGKPIDVSQLKPFDIVYFTLIGKDVISHTGVMLDNRRFIHTLQKRNCRVNSLEGFLKRKLRGARRVEESIDENLLVDTISHRKRS